METHRLSLSPSLSRLPSRNALLTHTHTNTHTQRVNERERQRKESASSLTARRRRRKVKCPFHLFTHCGKSFGWSNCPSECTVSLLHLSNGADEGQSRERTHCRTAPAVRRAAQSPLMHRGGGLPVRRVASLCLCRCPCFLAGLHSPLQLWKQVEQPLHIRRHGGV